MTEWIEREIQSEFEADLASNRMSLVPSDPWFAWIGERFPMGMNRIAWERVSERYGTVLPTPAGQTDEEHQLVLRESVSVISEWFAAEGIEGERPSVWVGDDSGFGIEMRIEVFMSCLPMLFSFPQHSYLIIPDGLGYCLNYVMEGDLFFAKCPPARSSKSSRRG